MSFWDQQFSAPGFKYGTAPNAFVHDQAWRLSPGSTVLVPGDGEGRNGVWLAGQGHHVTSADGSSVGLAKTRALAEERGVSIDTVQVDLTTWVPAPESVDGVVLTYVHLPSAVRATVHHHLLSALRVGGTLILEAFHPDQLTRTSGGPKDVTMLFTLDMLRGDVRGVGGAPFEELFAWEGAVQLDEGPGHRGEAMVTRFVVRRLPAGTQAS